MQDPKKSLSIFSFSPAQLRLLRTCLFFFLPIIVVYAVLELTVRKIPNYYSIVAENLKQNGSEIEVAIFGSSQIKNAINPEFIDKTAINLCSTAQHHNVDFEILKQTHDRMPNLKTVVFEVSYGHFEIPHNSKYYWKNASFLYYYDVNTYQRATSWKDELLFVSHPGTYSEILMAHLKGDSSQITYNRFAFETTNYHGKFKNLNYDEAKIKASYTDITRRTDAAIFRKNVAYFYDMLDYCAQQDLEIIIISPPTFSNYNSLRNTEILHRRDSILKVVSTNYKHIQFLNGETDADFKVTDFRNENHLNPDGAEKFTKKLNALLQATSN